MPNTSTDLVFKADQLRALREGLGFSQSEFAERLGVSRQAVNSWEAQETEPSIQNLLKIVNLTGAKLESFFGVA
jgi:transcriptional regulator with XRE-family HTH domain